MFSARENTVVERQTGRIFAPLLMVILTLVFMGVVIYQATREPDYGTQYGKTTESPDTSSESATPTADQASQDAADAASSPTPAETKSDPREEEIRKAILDFFARMPADHRELENPLSIQQAREDLKAYLASLSPDAAPLLIEILKQEEDFVNRRFLLYALADMGTPAAVDGLSEHYFDMASLDKDSEVNHTVKALAKVGSEYSFDVLLDFVERDATKQHKHRFVRALGTHPDAINAVPTFTRLMHEDSHVKVRLNAAQALKYTKDVPSAQEIEKALRSESISYVRQAMIGALGEIGDANSLRSLEEILQKDEDYVNRMSAVNAVGNIAGPESQRILEKVAKEDKHERVRFDAERKLRTLAGG